MSSADEATRFVRMSARRPAILSFLTRAWLCFSRNNGLRVSKYTVAPRLHTRAVQRRIFSALHPRILNTIHAEKGEY